MDHAREHPSRRSVVASGIAAAPAAVVAAGGRAYASGPFVDRLMVLERRHSARLGVYAHDTATGRTLRYRAHERFPLCSVFKTLAVAAVLRAGDPLSTRIRYTADDVAHAGYTPITGEPENLTDGMTLDQLCAAALCYSDNAAANLLLRQLGGPSAVTRFCRSVGDRTTRLDRWEPDLNSGEPWRVTDTTTPEAIGRTYARLVVGTALAAPGRTRLTGWLLANTTGGAKLRAGLPPDWTVADKTGTGGYGTSHDVGVVWPPGRPPVVLAVLTTKWTAAAPPDSPLIAETAAALLASGRL